MERIYQKNKQNFKGKMNKKEFLNELKEHLVGLSKDDVKEIIEDYEEHFKVGKKKKRKEFEIAKSLGNPKEIAREVRKELKKDKESSSFESGLIEFWVGVKKTSKDIYFNLKKEIPNAVNSLARLFKSGNKKRSSWKIFGTVLLNFILTIVWIGLLCLIFGLIISFGAVVISGIVTFLVAIFSLSMPFAGALTNLFLSGLFAGIGLICIGMIFIILFSLLFKGFVKITKKYLNWNKKMFRGEKNEKSK